jgi:hypothetical protein
MHFRSFVTLAIISTAQFAYAQTVATAAPPTPPGTKIEAFSSITGIVMIRGFSTIGRVRGQGVVTVDARESTGTQASRTKASMESRSK